MGVLDFLFEGKPPPSVTTYGSSTESMPKWMSDYLQGTVSRANAISGEGYQSYGGPRIAGFTPNQQQGFDLTKTNVGSYKPGMDLARSFEEQAADTSAVGAASPYVSKASQTFPEARAAYMDPYTDDVINRSELDASRFYNEKIAPSLNKQFTAAGQYGSSAHEREADRAARDLTEGLQSTSLAARSQGYQTAGTLFNQDASRAGQLASTVGNLATQDAATKGQAGHELGALTDAQYRLGTADATALGAIGTQEQGLNQANLDLGYQDFQAQRDYPRQQVDWLNGILHGLPHDSTTSTTATGPLSGSSYQPSNASTILGLLSAVKGMGTDSSGNFDWGNILGNSDKNSGVTQDWARGGRVNTESLDEMMKHLRSKSSDRIPVYEDRMDIPQYEDGQ